MKQSLIDSSVFLVVCMGFPLCVSVMIPFYRSFGFWCRSAYTHIKSHQLASLGKRFVNYAPLEKRLYCSFEFSLCIMIFRIDVLGENLVVNLQPDNPQDQLL